MKGEIPQPGGFEAARAETRARFFPNAERKLACKEAFYKTFLGKERFSSPEQLPDSLFLPAQALGDIQQAIQKTYEKGREYSQFVRWHPQEGFTPSRLYKGRALRTSYREGLHAYLLDKPITSQVVALQYHTHPPDPNLTLTPDYHDIFSYGDITKALYRKNTPIHLLATYEGIYGLVQTEVATRWPEEASALQDETIHKVCHPWYQDIHSIETHTEDLQTIGFGLYRWEIPLLQPLTYEERNNLSFRANWEEFFKSREADEMRTQGITMTKLITYSLEDYYEDDYSSPETRVFGQL